MRVISGSLKGKKILIPHDKNTRPLRDMVKESIFNLIKHSKKLDLDINNSNILDLFSGTGSFGLECFSRGCKNVMFVENYSKILDILKKNIRLRVTSAALRTVDFKGGIDKFLKTAKNKNLSARVKKLKLSIISKN